MEKWTPIVNDKLEDITYACVVNGSDNTYFERTGDKEWTCTHGGWTLYVDKNFEITKEMLCRFPHLKGYKLTKFLTTKEYKSEFYERPYV